MDQMWDTRTLAIGLVRKAAALLEADHPEDAAAIAATLDAILAAQPLASEEVAPDIAAAVVASPFET
jgi:hypothetical protein